MTHSGIAKLSEELTSAPPFKMEVLTAAELDAVSGGWEEGQGYSADSSVCTSQCHVDGNMETGTS